MKRMFYYFAVLQIYWLVWSPKLTNGWMGLDDYALVQLNPFLGHGWSSFVWGLTDVRFGRRWTPLLWSMLTVLGRPTVQKMHLLVFLLGAVLCFLVAHAFRKGIGMTLGFFASVAFAVSPMRYEVFSWEMGFVYDGMAILIMLAWLDRRSPSWCCLFLLLALLVYPSAAGAVLLGIWFHRGKWQSWFLCLFLVLVFAVQMELRVHIGFIPWQHRWDAMPRVLPHYFLMIFWPVVNIPIFPAVFYALIPIGCGLLVMSLCCFPVETVVWIVLMLPVLLASVTESFWFGTRYCLVPDIWALYCIGKEISWRRIYQGTRFVHLGLIVYLCCLLAFNVREGWMWRDGVSLIEGVHVEGNTLGRDLSIDLHPEVQRAHVRLLLNRWFMEYGDGKYAHPAALVPDVLKRPVGLDLGPPRAAEPPH